jgi:hypothetical protein
MLLALFDDVMHHCHELIPLTLKLIQPRDRLLRQAELNAKVHTVVALLEKPRGIGAGSFHTA